MNYLLHRQKFPNSVVSIPDGLPDLMSDICREVLRTQPSSNEIYSFIATYLEALLETRHKIQITKATISDIISRATNIVDLLQVDGVTLEQANETVNVLKETFNDLVDDKRQEKFNYSNLKELREAEIISELVKKCELTRNQVLSLKPLIQEAFKNFINEYFRALRGMTLKIEEVNPILKFTLEKYFKETPSKIIIQQAAITIQAAFRGYRTRKVLRKSIKNVPGAIRLNEVEFRKCEKLLKNLTPAEYKKMNEAATVIQRAYRRNLDKVKFRGSLCKRISSEVLKEVFLKFQGRAMHPSVQL